MRDFTETLADLRRRVEDARAYLQIDAARARLTELEQEASRADLWEDPDQARKVTTELARLRDDLELFDGLEDRVSEAETLFELGREEGDDSVEPEIDTAVGSLSSDLDTLELRALFTEVLARTSAIGYAGEPSYLRSNFQRGVKQLPVTWAA